MIRARSFLLAGALTLGALPARADEVVTLPAGTRVRLTVAGAKSRLMGELLALDAASVRLRTPGRVDSTVVSRGDLMAFAISSGRSSRGAHAALGGLIGLGLGVVAGLAAGSDAQDSYLATSAGAKALALGVGFGLIGTLVGVAIPARETWTDLPLDRVQVGLDMGPRRGARVAMALSF